MKANKGIAKAPSRTLYYELLGVDPKSATNAEIKKAYYRKARELHPDKGGDEENFKKMKYAYDVLTDTKKRKAYDDYGEPGVRFAEGNPSMEAAMQLFLNFGTCERLFLLTLVTIIFGYLLLFPILLSYRWDHPRSMNFAHVFIPIWLALGFGLSALLCCVQSPSFPDPEDEDEDMRKEMQEQHQQQISEHRRVRWGSVSVLLFLTMLLLFLVLRLDGEISWSYFLVIWPWMVLELGQFAYKFYTAESHFLMTGHDPEVILGKKWMNKDWNHFIIAFTSPHIFNIAFACLLALKMDGAFVLTWWEVFIPLWVDWVLGTVLVLLKCGKIKSADEMRNMSVEARALEESVGTVVCKVSLRFIWLGFLVLLCFKLTRPSAFPAWIMFLPIFCTAGCFCCCLSCFLCCMSPESVEGMMEEQEDQEVGGAAKVGAARYGTMK